MYRRVMVNNVSIDLSSIRQSQINDEKLMELRARRDELQNLTLSLNFPDDDRIISLEIEIHDRINELNAQIKAREQQ